jgi:NIPSNAP
MFYELATLTLRLGTFAQAVPAVKAYLDSPDAHGQLLGCWQADIGELNRIVIFREFADELALQAERRRVLLSLDPFGCAEFAPQVELNSYAPFPGFGPIQTGAHGPIYELRTYELKTGGLQPTLDAWAAALPARHAFSPCLMAMYALDGKPRITSIWPVASLEQRAKARAESVQQGVWPPKGGPAWLTTQMHSTIFLPTPISPLN